MRRFLTPCILALCVSLAGCGGGNTPRTQACRPERVASLPLRLTGAGLITVASIDDVRVPMVVDTGSELMTVTQPTVNRLHLSRNKNHKVRITGVNGAVESEAAKIERFSLGGQDTDQIEVGVASLASPARDDRAIAGVIGIDYFSFYDLDFNLAQGRLDLWRTAGCGAAFKPDAALGGTKLLRTVGRRMLIEASIDGGRAVMLLDTGAPASLITRTAALRLGVTDAALAADPASTVTGADGNPVQARMHRFPEMIVAGQTLHDVPLAVAPVDLHQSDVLLGDDWLANRRVWVSYAADTLFLMPPGS